MSANPSEQRILELEKENAELKHANEILQEDLGFFRAKPDVVVSESSMLGYTLTYYFLKLKKQRGGS